MVYTTSALSARDDSHLKSATSITAAHTARDTRRPRSFNVLVLTERLSVSVQSAPREAIWQHPAESGTGQKISLGEKRPLCPRKSSIGSTASRSVSLES